MSDQLKLAFQAPAPKIKTPGTRLVWSTCSQWLSGWAELSARRPAAATFRARDAHLQALEENLHLVAGETRPEVLLALASICKCERPSRRLRAGHPTTAILVEANNRLARLIGRAIKKRSVTHAWQTDGSGRGRRGMGAVRQGLELPPHR